MEIDRVDGGTPPGVLRELSEVLYDCVKGGASVGFVEPFTIEMADEYFLSVMPAVDRGERVLLAARINGEVAGTVQVILSSMPNQRHRGEIAKMLVHRRARKSGIATALLAEAERCARDAGKSLLVLDTVTGSDAERLYAKLGWVRVGEIPRYALFPDHRYCSTTYFYKRLD